MAEPTCHTCRFAREDPPHDLQRYGQLRCHRFPPIVVPHSSSCATWSAEGWPRVLASDGCGEHRPHASAMTPDVAAAEALRPTGPAGVCAVHCSICEGQDHHWFYVGDEDEAGEPVMSCKHCDATRPVEDDDDG